MDSILTTVRKSLGMEPDYTHFDSDIILAINSALMSLSQLGIGPQGGFMITGQTETWTDLLGDRKDLEGAKLYVQSKTKLAFDPPGNQFLVDAMERQIKELEWRLYLEAETSTITTTTTTTVEGEP